MYSFEGDFRRKPIVSLRGASTKEGKSSLLQRNQTERIKREQERIRNRSAIILQAFLRSCVTRHAVKEKFRTDWDADVLKIQKTLDGKKIFDADQIISLQRRLLLFYKEDIDFQRLIWLCQSAVQQKDVWIRKFLFVKKEIWLHQMRRLLTLACKLLSYHANSLSVSLASPLRLLEVYTDNAVYTHYGITEEDSFHLVSNLQQYLIEHGYFNFLRVFINAKLPPDVNIDSLPPLAQSMEELILRPIKCALRSNALSHARSFILCAMCQGFFSHPYSDQISNFLLPTLAQSAVLPLKEFLNALSPLHEDNTSLTNMALRLQPSPWLLYAVVSIVGNNLDSLSTECIVRYLNVIHSLLPTLPSAETQRKLMEMLESDDEGEIAMETEFGNASSVGEIREQCLQQLNSPSCVQCLKRAADNGDEATLTALCSICHLMMTEHLMHVPRTRLLFTLAFSGGFFQHLWKAIQSHSTTLVTGTHLPLLTMLSRGIHMSKEDSARIIPLLSVFSSLFGHLLQSLHDSEFYGDNKGKTKVTMMPFDPPILVSMSRALRDACLGIIDLAYPETRHSVDESYTKAMDSVGVKKRDNKEVERQCAVWMHCFKVTSQLVKQLYDRDVRRRFCPDRHWLASYQIYTEPRYPGARGHISRFFRPRRLRFWNSPDEMEDDEGPPPSTHDARKMAVLAELPFLVPFQERVKIFRDWIQQEKEDEYSETASFLPGKSIDITIRRNFIYEDAFDKLRPENEKDLRKRLKVTLKNAHGLDEAGIDGGGITREFLHQLLKTAVDPKLGFFKTTHGELLYPNPQASTLHEDYRKHYYFIGRLIGKILYENLLVELPFASFFLSKILSRHSDVDIHHLASLDPVMYKNLLSLKDYEGDVKDLELDFTVVDESIFGVTKTYELKYKGSHINVTNANKIEYIHLMADFKLNKQIREHIRAFREGLSNVIDLEWLRMFDHNELQTLISGASVPIDVEDMMNHTMYSGDYTLDDPVIQNFWRVVRGMTDDEKCSLLKFITSCSRPPLLGFKELYPALCIQSIGDQGRLPSASTCMHLLKLPKFQDIDTMKEKLLYAIKSGAGFEFS